MKKVIALAFATMMLLALALAAYGTENEIRVEYDMTDVSGYEIDIPASVPMNASGVGTLPIDITMCHENGVAVTLRSSNYSNGWRMKGTRGYYLPYTISGPDGNVTQGLAIYINKNSGASLTFAVDPVEQRKALADNYSDIITYTLEAY